MFYWKNDYSSQIEILETIILCTNKMSSGWFKMLNINYALPNHISNIFIYIYV